MGSSPPVRGALFLIFFPPGRGGLIPARAGSTIRRPPCPPRPQAHPRPCGEHLAGRWRRRAQSGSSPPVRGAPAGARCGGGRRGLIPARAGSTADKPGKVAGLRAHPRPCGEHVLEALRLICIQGSSPPVRGALVHNGGATLTLGLIPARAGSTNAHASPTTPIRAHPRPCGEHNFEIVVRVPSGGSSPPVRGAPCQETFPRVCGGLIPARAGSTLACFPRCQLVRAHPRPCGEHTC